MPTYNYMAENGLTFAKMFGERVKARRKELGLSQGQLYELTGISPSYISAVEKGTSNPSLDIMVQISVALKVDLADLLKSEA